MLALPFAPCVQPFAPCVQPFVPCILAFAPCACGVSLSNGQTIPLAQAVVVTSCNLRWWCFFIQQLAEILHCVMAVCVGSCIWSGGGVVVAICETVVINLQRACATGLQ